MKQSEEQFDRMLREHFGSKLNPTLGRSEMRFQLSLKPTAHRAFWNRTVLTIGTIGISAVAAAIAMAITLSPNKPVPTVPVNNVVVSDGSDSQKDFQATNLAFNDDFAPRHVASQLVRRTTDEGTIYFDDGTPMRQIRQREIQHSVFLDPRTGRFFEVRVPSETVKLLGLQQQ